MIAALAMAVILGVDTPLPDARQEARAQTLMREIRCVVCENEPVSHSTADIAVDMRRTIRVQIAEGSTNSEVRRYFADRYGDFVLFRPPSQGWAVILWAFPFVLLGGAGAFLALRARSRRLAPLAPLPDEAVGDP